jgi:hypothetical protein
MHCNPKSGGWRVGLLKYNPGKWMSARNMDMSALNGKVAIVTGASSGIGRAAATLFAQ